MYFASQLIQNHNFMKKITLFLFFLTISFSMNAQFTEGFEADIPSDWTVINEGGANGWVQNTAPAGGALEGSSVAGLTYNATAHDDYLITPAITVASGVNEYISFNLKARSASYPEPYEVLLSTTNPSAAEFTVELQASTDTPNAWTNISFDLTAYEGQTVYVAIRATGTDDFALYVDDVYSGVTPGAAPDCVTTPTPENGATDVAIDSSTGSITIGWTAATSGEAATAYEIFWGTTSGDLTSIGSITDTTVNITNINYATTYYWSIVPKNQGGSATDCVEWSFTSAAFVPPTPDYLNNFTVFPGTQWSEAAGAYGSPAGTTGGWAQDDYANDTSSTNGKSAKINIYGTATDEYLVTNAFDLSAGNAYLNFDLALTVWNATTASTMGDDDYLALLVTTDDGTNWAELARWDVSSTITAAGGPVDEISLAGYTNNTKFAFYAFSDTTGGDNDLFMDNFQITSASLTAVTAPTEAAPTPPAREAGDVVSIFSDAYTDVTLTELPTSWSDVTTFEATTVASDNVWKLSGLEFLGMVTNYDTGIDVSTMEMLHIDYWVPTGVENELLIKIVNTIDGGEDIESLGTTVSGSWQSIDIDMTGFVGNLANTEKITQILIDAVNRADTVFVDNFYFYKAPTSSADVVFITELADPNDNAGARYVEIYNGGSSSVDLTGWTLRRYTNGNSEPQTSGEDLTPIGTLAPGAIAIIAANGESFAAAFGMEADISAGTGGPADSNGDDQIYITDASDAIVDFFGVPGEDGSGTDHEFEDGRAERKASVTQGTATWDVNEWNIDNDGGAGDGAVNVGDDVFDPGVWIGEGTAGLDDQDLSTLSMYPNPATNFLNISAQNTINSVEIFNILGQKVISMSVEDTSASINISNLNTGIYLIKYVINNRTSTKKFVKN